MRQRIQPPRHDGHGFSRCVFLATSAAMVLAMLIARDVQAALYPLAVLGLITYVNTILELGWHKGKA